MRASTIVLRVSDLDRAVDFWSARVGLPVVSTATGFAFLDAGTVRVALNLVDSVPRPGLTELVLEVEDVVGVHGTMTDLGVPFEVDLRPVTGDGERVLLAAHFRDPDGNLASLTGWVVGF